MMSLLTCPGTHFLLFEDGQVVSQSGIAPDKYHQIERHKYHQDTGAFCCDTAERLSPVAYGGTGRGNLGEGQVSVGVLC